jgi:hypothetical protein
MHGTQCRVSDLLTPGRLRDEECYKNVTEIPYCEAITYSEFVFKHLIPNIPLILGGSLTQRWRARQNWVDDEGKPNWTYLKQNFGNSQVDVADCNQKWFSDQPKTTMPFNQFLDKWRESKVFESKSKSAEEWKGYLKDWHFGRDFKEHGAYEVFDIFKDDWLNLWFDKRDDDDYRFGTHLLSYLLLPSRYTTWQGKTPSVHVIGVFL